ncbi:MAG: porin family protein [Gammaproteobacteria bacterium]|nr:porin family protein [Gammaproteobacteria bacterium]
MNKKYLLAGLFVASFGITSIAAAGAGDTYIGSSLGNASPDSSGFDSALEWKIFGGYALSDILAVEGGYVSFGKMDGSTIGNVSTSIEPTGFEVAAVGNFPINSQFSLFGKAGLLAWDSKATVSLGNASLSGSTTGTDIFYGAGANMKFRAIWPYALAGNATPSAVSMLTFCLPV